MKIKFKNLYTFVHILLEHLKPHVTVGGTFCFSSNSLCSAIDLNEFTLTLNSKPTSITSELRKINVPEAIIVPMDPYNTLYRLKLFKNIENPIVVNILKNVAIIAPGEIRCHRFCMEGAYL